MELKPYQQHVIRDLRRYLHYIQEEKDLRTSFRRFWEEHERTPLQPALGARIEPYKNNITNVPHVCMKVPTAGGKTFIACNALRPIFDAFDSSKPRAVLWLVPSVTILQQTLKSLKNPTHPYRQKINAHFGNKVEVFDKDELLQGSGFNATSVKEQLTIMVLSFDSLRATNKENRKVFQENGQLQSFESLLKEGDDITLGEVIKYLKPVVIVDESHNAETDLSINMLKTSNPSFILDLTATPRNNSNILSFIDALELKRENMVKLPVIVYNHKEKNEVINSALQLQKKLEKQANEEHKKGGRYIRPIILFQAEPKNKDDTTTFRKLKEKLIQLRIPEEQIKIKTADLNEIKDIDLMSYECPVRYIITINALKEGWDCPFAYILATLAHKSSAVDVEQILGRILRQPYVSRHGFPLLNMSYVLTSSSRFMDTLQNIVKGLNRAGFSEKDYRLTHSELFQKQDKDIEQPELPGLTNPIEINKPAEEKPGGTELDDDALINDIDPDKITVINEEAENQDDPTAALEQAAIEKNKQYDEQAKTEDKDITPSEIQEMVKTYRIKEVFRQEAFAVSLPQFFLKTPHNELFGDGETELAVERSTLLENFELSKADIYIDFDHIDSELYKVDLDSTKKEHTPSFLKIDGRTRDDLLSYILDNNRTESRIKNLSHRIVSMMGSMSPIPDAEIQKYVKRVLEEFSDERFSQFAEKEYSYIQKIKQKIVALSKEYAEKQFKNYLDTDKIYTRNSFTFPEHISTTQTSKDIIKSLYEKEAYMNTYEERVINEIGNMENIMFWTRNMERRGFCINGFLNHYPDFIIQTKQGKTILLETKGDHLDAEQKIRLGKLWANKAGNAYRYFMVYEKRNVQDAYRLDEFLKLIREL